MRAREKNAAHICTQLHTNYKYQIFNTLQNAQI